MIGFAIGEDCGHQAIFRVPVTVILSEDLCGAFKVGRDLELWLLCSHANLIASPFFRGRARCRSIAGHRLHSLRGAKRGRNAMAGPISCPPRGEVEARIVFTSS